MKRIGFIFLLAFAAPSLLAAPGAYQMAQASGTTNAAAIFPADFGASIRLVSLDVKSDLSSSKLAFLSTGAEAQLSAVATNATNFAVLSTNGFAAGNAVVLQHLADGSAWRAVVHSVSQTTNGTNIAFTAQITGDLAAGDRIFQVTTNAQIDIGAATVRRDAEALFVAPRGRPLVLQLSGTSACTLNQAVVHYTP